MRSVTRLGLVRWGLTPLLCGALAGCAARPNAAPLGGSDPAQAHVAKSQQRRASADEASEAAPDTEAPPTTAGAQGPDALAAKTAEPIAADPSQGVTFTTWAIHAGDVMSMRLRFGVNGSVRVPMAGMDDLDVDVTAEYETRTEYLKVADGKVLEYRVEYMRDQIRGTVMGQAHSETSPLAGNAYLIDESGGRFVARRTDGRKITREEEAELRENHDEEKPEGGSAGSSGGGDEGKEFDFIPDRPIVVGESFPLPEGALKSLKEHADVLSNVRLRFDGVRDHDGVRVGVFTIIGKVDSELPQVGRVRAKPRGEMWVAVDGEYPTHLALTGDVDADVATEGVTLQGNGSFSIGGRFTYELADKPAAEQR